MAVYERCVWIDAPLETVWDFHSTVDGLVAVTPDWMRLRVEEVTGPEGTTDQEILVVGSSVRLSVRPFGVGPRQSWTSMITDRDWREDRAVFRDEMRAGPFARWQHSHRFYAEAGGTRMIDRVEYSLPDPVGPLSTVARPFFEPMFRSRHRRTKRLLE